MRTRAVVAGGLLALAGVWAISAVGQSMLIEPAEYPPASYEGREYVDSNGCVFIRAGVDGAVTWVPRVTRDRKPVCGFDPTFTLQQLAALNAAEAEAMAAAVTPAPMPVVVAEPEPKPMSTPTVVAASDPNVVNDIYVGPSVVGGSNLSSGGYATTGSSGSVATNVPGQVVNDIYVGGSTGTASYLPTNIGATTYAQGSSLSISVPNTRGGIPAGYKQAWDDGRVNPQRGPRSATGDAEMNRIWTQTIPRQLIADVGGVQRVRGTVGNTVARIVPWMSTKELAPGSAGDYIQIGAYGSADNVHAAISRLSQMGMNAAVQGTGSVQVVLAGPFSAADVRSALNHLRSAGYSDAFVQ